MKFYKWFIVQNIHTHIINEWYRNRLDLRDDNALLTI